MASSLSNTQGRIFWALPAAGMDPARGAHGWMTCAEVLAAAGLPESARPRLKELLAKRFVVRRKRRADGLWEYQRAPMDLEGGE